MFQKGQPRPAGAGRRKGQVNKLSLHVLTRLEELGFDPIKKMVDIAMAKTTPIEVRGKMCSELAQYVWPKRKAVEHSGFIDGSIVSGADPIDALRSRVAGIIERERASGVLPIADTQRTGTD